MPRRDDLKSILLIGSGPIVIGQACEFDYSGTQACKALREEGYRIILANSNPATIMTDPEFADATYVEPLTADVLEAIIAKERPDALLPTIGGQTGLNLALELAARGALERYGVELIGANLESIHKAEDREKFKDAMTRIGLNVTRSGYARSFADAERIVKEEAIEFPIILRPSFTLGGFGGSVAYNAEEFVSGVQWGINASPVGEVLVEQSIIGWKEYELEVMRDCADNCVIVCSIENLDPMGVHTGDSITVAPAQTLTDKEYQRMRDAALAIMREIGVDTGGSNVQFAVNPADGDLIVVEMNPRVSRSSALASKATGFPIAKIAAKLAVGYRLDELVNDITKSTPACFEPAIDYVVTKIPRFTFEKFPQTPAVLTTQMKSVGEAMSFGRTFTESLQKAMRSLELGRSGFVPLYPARLDATDRNRLIQSLRVPSPDRLWHLGDALRHGFSHAEIHELTGIDPWFIAHIGNLISIEGEVVTLSPEEFESSLRSLKREGFSDERLAQLRGVDESEVRAARHRLGVRPVYKRVDTCAAEFDAETPYLYSTYEQECEAAPQDVRKVVILGSGPNRIGQGIEFDYCCVHGVIAARDAGYQAIMINCNPETVSTDYDTADRLYFEPLTHEDVLEILHVEQPMGVVVQFGGQTPLQLAHGLQDAGIKILGTSVDAIDRAEDRERFGQLVDKLGLKQPRNGLARTAAEALQIAQGISYPIIVRPSYVLGGRAMEIVHSDDELTRYLNEAVNVTPDRPVLIDEFLEDAVELDVDAVSDGTNVVVVGIMEHIEEAGVHSGDSACSLPPHQVPGPVLDVVRDQTKALALELGVVGLMNIQFAVRGRTVYVLEVNPRASRTVPFVSKATGLEVAKLAARAMYGDTLPQMGLTHEPVIEHTAVKDVVFPFARFPGNDTILSPEMKSTGEVMGVDASFERAFFKAQKACGFELPSEGCVFISVKDADKPMILGTAKKLVALGFTLIATRGTAEYLNERGVKTDVVKKVSEGRPHVVDRMLSGEVQLVFNTTVGRRAIEDSRDIRRTAYTHNIPYQTTVPGALASAAAIEAVAAQPEPHVVPLQELYRATRTAK